MTLDPVKSSDVWFSQVGNRPVPTTSEDSTEQVMIKCMATVSLRSYEAHHSLPKQSRSQMQLCLDAFRAQPHSSYIVQLVRHATNESIASSSSAATTSTLLQGTKATVAKRKLKTVNSSTLPLSRTAKSSGAAIMTTLVTAASSTGDAASSKPQLDQPATTNPERACVNRIAAQILNRLRTCIASSALPSTWSIQQWCNASQIAVNVWFALSTARKSIRTGHIEWPQITTGLNHSLASESIVLFLTLHCSFW